MKRKLGKRFVTVEEVSDGTEYFCQIEPVGIAEAKRARRKLPECCTVYELVPVEKRKKK